MVCAREVVLPWVHTVVLSVEVPALSVHFLSVTKQEAETQTVLQRCKLYQRLFLHQKSSAEAHRAVTTVCSMPLLQKRNQVFERVFCAYVQPATHCRCCAPAAAPVQLETMTKALNPFPVRRKSNGHPRSVFHSSTA